MAKGVTQIDGKIVEVLNTIREAGTTSYQNCVPKLTENDVLERYGATILNQPAIMNEFLNSFMNFFMYEVTKQHMFESEFDRLKTISSPLRYGTFESFTNTIKPMNYKMEALNRILTLYVPDVKTAYFTRTREDVFPMSVAEEKLEGAFMSNESFNTFVNDLYTALVRSNKVVEYNAIKECINVNVLGGAVKVVTIPKITEANAKNVAKMIRSYFHKMQKPSTEYNNYINLEGATGDAVETNTPEEALLLITDADTEAEIGVDVLASMYNLPFGNTSMYDNNHITVDDFGYNVYDRENRVITEHKSSKIRFMICDEAFFKIEDKLTMKASGYNDAGLVMQNFYHIWQAIDIRPWANCVVFVEEDEEEFEFDKANISLSNDNESDLTNTITATPDTTTFTEDDIKCLGVQGFNNDVFGEITTETYDTVLGVTISDNTITFEQLVTELPSGVTDDQFCNMVFDIKGKIIMVDLLVTS